MLNHLYLTSIFIVLVAFLLSCVPPIRSGYNNNNVASTGVQFMSGTSSSRGYCDFVKDLMIDTYNTGYLYVGCYFNSDGGILLYQDTTDVQSYNNFYSSSSSIYYEGFIFMPSTKILLINTGVNNPFSQSLNWFNTNFSIPTVSGSGSMGNYYYNAQYNQSNGMMLYTSYLGYGIATYISAGIGVKPIAGPSYSLPTAVCNSDHPGAMAIFYLYPSVLMQACQGSSVIPVFIWNVLTNQNVQYDFGSKVVQMLSVATSVIAVPLGGGIYR